jgi:hypothetical protein
MPDAPSGKTTAHPGYASTGIAGRDTVLRSARNDDVEAASTTSPLCLAAVELPHHHPRDRLAD